MALLGRYDWGPTSRKSEFSGVGRLNDRDEADDYLTAKTQMAPPWGTSGYSPGNWVFNRACMARESIPQPDCTATYCLPSTMKDEGCPMIPEFVGNSHSSLPVAASKA